MKSGSWLIWVLLASVVVAGGVSIYKYTIAKDFTYLVEAPCDYVTNKCYVRDCENDYCPPNGLSEYRVFSLPAKEFTNCTDNSCLSICPSVVHACEELFCADGGEAECFGPIREPSIIINSTNVPPKSNENRN